MQYRIKYNLYRVEAKNLEEARHKALSILGRNLEDIVSVEIATERRPFWKLLLLGR